jgi:hypothetical protein
MFSSCRTSSEKGSMIWNTFDNEVLEPKNDFWGHLFEVPHSSEAEEVRCTLPIKLTTFSHS